MKYNDANVARQKELHRSHKSAAVKPKGKGGKAGRSSTGRESKTADARSEGSVNDPDSRYKLSTFINKLKTEVASE